MPPPDKPTRWRPRFSVRTLVVIVTLVCAYLALWKATKTLGAEDVSVHTLKTTFGGLASDAELRELASNGMGGETRVPVPFVVNVTHHPPLHFCGLPFFSGGLASRHEYYFWFFGYVAKLPYERELP